MRFGIMSDDWTERYRPRSLSEVIGNPTPVKELKDWALSWNNGIPKKRAVVLIGSPGIGKTSSAEALAREMGWTLIEMNASDQRTGNAIKETAILGSNYNSFGEDGEYIGSKKGGRKLIVLDEADNLFGNADRGALPVINELIKTTKQPVVLIVNDFYALSKKSSAIKNDTLQITFRKPSASSIASALKRIVERENITADGETLRKIAETASGDMRAAVRDLESLAHGKTEITIASAELLSGRVTREDMYDVLKEMFRNRNAIGSKRMLSNVDVDPETALIWVEENLPYEYAEPGDLVRGFEKLSRADMFLGRVHRRQYYGFWSYATDMMTAGVVTARMSDKTSHERFKFPQYLMKMSRSKAVRGMRNAVCLKIAKYLHTSTRRVEFDVLPSLRLLAENDAEIRIMLARDVMLEPEELGFLINAKIDSDIIKSAFANDKSASPKTIVSEEVTENVPASSVTKTTDKKPQSNLFDF